MATAEVKRFAFLITGILRDKNVKIDVLQKHTQPLTSEQLYTTLSSGRNTDGCTAMHRLACQGHMAAISHVLGKLTSQQRFDLLKIQNEKLSTALHQSAEHGSTVVQALLSGLTPTQRFKLFRILNISGNVAVLHYAAWKGHEATMRFTLEQLTELERYDLLKIQNKAGNTPLHLAAWYGSVSLVEFMLSSVSESQRAVLLSVGVREGNSVMDLAVRQRKVEVVECLRRFQSQCMIVSEQTLQAAEIESSAYRAVSAAVQPLQERLDHLELLYQQQLDSHAQLVQQNSQLMANRDQLQLECAQLRQQIHLNNFLGPQSFSGSCESGLTLNFDVDYPEDLETTDDENSMTLL